MLTVYRYAMKYKWMIVIALIFMLIELVVELIQPLFIQQVIDNGIMVNNVDNVIMYLLIMFGVLGGIASFGLIGLFIGPVILAVLLAIWREWLHETKIEPVMMPKATMAHDLDNTDDTPSK